MKKQVNFWFFTSKNISEISKKFSNAFDSIILDTDYENVYEWSQQMLGDIYVNISRNHTKARKYSPVLIFFQDYSFEDEQTKSFGTKLHKEFQAHVYHGNYVLQDNDELLLEVIETYGNSE